MRPRVSMAKKQNRQDYLKYAAYLLVLLLVCFAISEIVRRVPAVAAFDENWIDMHVRNRGLLGAVYFIGMAAMLTAIGLPRQLTAFLAGYAFGFTDGLIYSVIGATLSCATVFWLSRLFARRSLRKRFASHIIKLDSFVAIRPFLMTIVIRLMPFGNNLATNLLAGVSRMSGRVFIVGSMIGYIPQMAIFALVGNGILVHSYWKVTLSAGLLGLSLILGSYLYKQYSRQLPAVR